MRRTLLAVALAALVVLAGCHRGALPRTATPTPEGGATASPTPTATPTSTATPEHGYAGLAFPPGANESGFGNVSRLLRASDGVLNGTSYTLRYEKVRNGTNGTTVRRRVLALSAGGRSLVRERVAFRSGGPTTYSNATVWNGAGTGVLVRQGDRGSRTYTRYAPGNFVYGLFGNLGRLVYLSTVAQFLPAFRYEAVDGYTEADHDFVVYESTGVNGSHVEGALTPEYTGGNLTVTVRDDGLVTSLRGNVSVSTEEGTVEFAVNLTLERIGKTTVERPGWVTAEVPQLSATTIENGTVIRLTHEGGPAVDGATVSVGTGIVSGLETEIDAFGPGDTLYLYVVEEGDETVLTASSEQPDPGTAVQNFVEMETTMVTVQADGVTVHLNASGASG